MKKLYFGAAVLFLGLTSCSSSDDSTNNDSTNIYFPLSLTSSWNYDVKLDGNAIGNDDLFVSGESTMDGKIYQQLKTENIPNGFYTNALNNNFVRKEGDKILLSGTTGLELADLLPINIEVSDFVLFKENASPNAQLDVISGTMQQTLQDMPMDITYSLKSTFKESLASFTVPGKETYSDVKVIKVVANLKVTTDYMIPVINTLTTITILNPQDVIVSTQYYAEGVGMIYAKTDFNYQLNDFSQFNIELPIPVQGASTIEELMN
ncbi:hypothetical protein [Flavobacterium sp.]|uniref:hypothetical protein n=1 Tax=Flavobacterium sp. TaxID=239 RepID=UPI002601A539|nr:hypothetical protein [Flavobacterium sp.]MDD3004133.1 hypothetical protein [Flavobacterium sp.]